MKTSHFALAFLLVLGMAPVFGCGGDDDTDTNGGESGVQAGGLNTRSVKSEKARADSKINDADLSAFVKGQYDLNYDILRKSGDGIAKKNAMISIFSIQTALAMAWAGAAGDTAAEMKAVLKFGDHGHEALNRLDRTIMDLNKEAEDDPKWGLHADPIEIKTSNDLYLSPKYTWSSDWLDSLAVNYGSGITEMNFGADPEKAREYINKVVSDDTHERIKDLIPEGGITTDTQLVITNAIYFKAPWAEHLEKLDGKLDFQKYDGGIAKVDALRDLAHLQYAKGEDYQAVVESLRDYAFEIMFILPDEGKFDSVLASMDGEKILGIFDSLSFDKEVDLTFPMYQFTTELKLADTLRAMGMTKAFGDGADFSKMTEEENGLYISEVQHKSFIAVDEKGIEAAAATAVMMEDGMSMPDENVVLKIDRAFMFVIYERMTHTPLFVGHVMDPSQRSE